VLTTFGLSEKRYRLNQLRYDLRKLKGHELLEGDGSYYAYRLTNKGVVDVQPLRLIGGEAAAVLFLFFHKRLLCGPLANSRFHHRPDAEHRPNKQPARNRVSPGGQGDPVHCRVARRPLDAAAFPLLHSFTQTKESNAAPPARQCCR
jgi:hypothetical protein